MSNDATVLIVKLEQANTHYVGVVYNCEEAVKHIKRSSKKNYVETLCNRLLPVTETEPALTAAIRAEAEFIKYFGEYPDFGIREVVVS